MSILSSHLIKLLFVQPEIFGRKERGLLQIDGQTTSESPQFTYHSLGSINIFSSTVG